MDNIEAILDEHEKEGFVIIPGALGAGDVEEVRVHINQAREKGWEEGLNAVGNMWFDTLLDREPEIFGPLVGHESIRPVLERGYAGTFPFAIDARPARTPLRATR